MFAYQKKNSRKKPITDGRLHARLKSSFDFNKASYRHHCICAFKSFTRWEFDLKKKKNDTSNQNKRHIHVFIVKLFDTKHAIWMQSP